MSIDISKLSAADLAAIIEHARTVEAAEREARKLARERNGQFLARFVRLLAGGAAGPEQQFKSGAQGWSLGGKNIAVPLNPEDADSPVRMARVSILVRWEDTIPAADKD